MDWNHVTAVEVLSALREVRGVKCAEHAAELPAVMKAGGTDCEGLSLHTLSGRVEVTTTAPLGSAAAITLHIATLAQEVGSACQELGILLPCELRGGAVAAGRRNNIIGVEVPGMHMAGLDCRAVFAGTLPMHSAYDCILCRSARWPHCCGVQRPCLQL